MSNRRWIPVNMKTLKILMNICSLYIHTPGLQSSCRPDGVLRRPHTRGPPHRSRPRLREPVPGEEVLLQHPLMSHRRRRSSRYECRLGVAWLLCLHHTWSYWPSKALSWVLPGGHSVVAGQLCLSGWGFWGSQPPNWQPSERYHVLLNRFVIALLLENSLAQCLMRWKMCFVFSFFILNFLVLDCNLPQETENLPSVETSTLCFPLLLYSEQRIQSF